MQINPANLTSFQKGLQVKFREGIAAAIQRKRLWTPADLAAESKSTFAQEEIVWLDKIPRLKKWTANKEVQNLFARGFMATNEKYHNLHEIDEVDLERDNARGISAVMRGLVDGASNWRRWLLVDAIRNGGATFSGYVGYDGRPAFDTAHPIHPNDLAKGTQSNLISGKALNDANYEEMVALFQDFRGLDGEVLGVYPDVLLVPPKLEKTAARIVTARTVAAGGENVNAGSTKLIVMPELVPPGAAANDPVRDTWYLFSTNAMALPFEILVEKDPQANLRFNTAQGQNVDGDVVRTEKIVLDTPGRGCAYMLAWFLGMKLLP